MSSERHGPATIPPLLVVLLFSPFFLQPHWTTPVFLTKERVGLGVVRSSLSHLQKCTGAAGFFLSNSEARGSSSQASKTRVGHPDDLFWHFLLLLTIQDMRAYLCLIWKYCSFLFRIAVISIQAFVFRLVLMLHCK